MVFGTLLCLAPLLTVIAADIDLGVFNPIIALAIASTKAVIVILFFMHVKYQSNLIKMTVGCRLLHVPGADYDDADGLHQPRVGALVVAICKVVLTRVRPAGRSFVVTEQCSGMAVESGMAESAVSEGLRS